MSPDDDSVATAFHTCCNRIPGRAGAPYIVASRSDTPIWRKASHCLRCCPIYSEATGAQDWPARESSLVDGSLQPSNRSQLQHTRTRHPSRTQDVGATKPDIDRDRKYCRSPWPSARVRYNSGLPCPASGVLAQPDLVLGFPSRAAGRWREGCPRSEIWGRPR